MYATILRTAPLWVLKSFIKYYGKNLTENYKSFNKYAYMFLFFGPSGPKQGEEVPHPVPPLAPRLELLHFICNVVADIGLIWTGVAMYLLQSNFSFVGCSKFCR